MRVAVTGGAGFIGSYTTKWLSEHGHEAVIVDRTHGADILEDHAEEYFKHCKAVIHLAGVLGTDELFDEPEHAIDVNVKGTAKVLKACVRHEMVYVGITMPHVWDNIYQATKLGAEALCRAYHRHYGVPYSLVRAHNAFGPGQHVGRPQKFMPTWSTSAWKGEPIPIWGDGTQLIDPVHADDVARMLVDALRFGDGETFDAGWGIPLTVNQVSDWVLDAAGSKGGKRYLPMRRGEHAGASVIAKGEGWDRLSWKPRPDDALFAEAVRSYR